uniref:Lysosomal acid phosphatase n=1 Tax=Syphacia muris TaxID=451379 RepID=A0A0N5AHB2_9BILA
MLPLSVAIILAFGVCGASAQRELVYVQAIWRHGDRAPNKLPYPNDLNTEASWPRGWAQLTNIGMQELYKLGQFFKDQYSDFIGNRFDLNKIMVTSTNSERAIVSAQAFLYGMYPASGDDVWMDGETWQPLPFFSRTFGDEDAMLRPTNWNCSLYEKVLEEQNKELFAELENQFSSFFAALQNVTGFSKVDLKTAASLNNIKREIIHKMPQPSWVLERWEAYGNQTAIDIIMELKRITRISEFNSPEKARLRGGLLLNDWLKRAENVSADVVVKPAKMNLYSTHDGTVSSLMYALGIGDDKLIPYAACLIMEVYKTVDNNSTITEVKFLYKNDTSTNNMHLMIVPGCTDYCPIKNLTTLLSDAVISSVSQLNEVCCSVTESCQ